MRYAVLTAITSLALCTSAQAQLELEKGFAGALRGCEEWVLNPASWTNGVQPFVSVVGLGDKMGLVQQVDDHALPPKELRAGDHFWRINSTAGAGYVLVVSDKMPMCHITGGGNTDLQPIVSSVLSSPAFKEHWKLIKETSTSDMASSEFVSLAEPKFFITISRADRSGERLDRVQVLATAIFKAN